MKIIENMPPSPLEKPSATEKTEKLLALPPESKEEREAQKLLDDLREAVRGFWKTKDEGERKLIKDHLTEVYNKAFSGNVNKTVPTSVFRLLEDIVGPIVLQPKPSTTPPKRLSQHRIAEAIERGEKPPRPFIVDAVRAPAGAAPTAETAIETSQAESPEEPAAATPPETIAPSPLEKPPQAATQEKISPEGEIKATQEKWLSGARNLAEKFQSAQGGERSNLQSLAISLHQTIAGLESEGENPAATGAVLLELGNILRPVFERTDYGEKLFSARAEPEEKPPYEPPREVTARRARLFKERFFGESERMAEEFDDPKTPRERKVELKAHAAEALTTMRAELQRIGEAVPGATEVLARYERMARWAPPEPAPTVGAAARPEAAGVKEVQEKPLFEKLEAVLAQTTLGDEEKKKFREFIREGDPETEDALKILEISATGEGKNKERAGAITRRMASGEITPAQAVETARRVKILEKALR